MNESVTSPYQQRPSALGAFFKGARGGLFSGIVMALVVAAIVPAMPWLTFGLVAAHGTFMSTLIASGPLMVLAPTLFGGLMAAQRALFGAPERAEERSNIVPVTVPGMSGPAIVPVMTPAMSAADTAPEQQEAPTKSWVAQTRSADSRNTIEQILANGSLSDKDRASAILASREAADQQASRA